MPGRTLTREAVLTRQHRVAGFSQRGSGEPRLSLRIDFP